MNTGTIDLLNVLEPKGDLKDLSKKIADYPMKHLEELLPAN